MESFTCALLNPPEIHNIRYNFIKEVKWDSLLLKA
jgi:hypothetical protein